MLHMCFSQQRRRVSNFSSVKSEKILLLVLIPEQMWIMGVNVDVTSISNDFEEKSMTELAAGKSESAQLRFMGFFHCVKSDT